MTNSRTANNIKQDELDAKLLRAVAINDMSLVSSLVTKGANVNAHIMVNELYLDTAGHKHNLEGQTPLCVAAQNGNTELVDYLIGHGADVKGRDLYGESALHYAARECKVDTTKLLLRCGADANAKDSYFNMTPLHDLTANRSNNYLRVDESIALAKLLVEHGADVDAQNIHNETPVELAVKLQRPHLAGTGLVDYLLEAREKQRAELDVKREVQPLVDKYVHEVSEYKRRELALGHDLDTGRPKEVADKMFRQLAERIEKSMKDHGLDPTRSKGGWMPEPEDSILSEAYQRVLDNERKWKGPQENEAAPPKKTASASDPYPLSEQQITPGFTKAATAAMAQAAPTADPKSGATLRPGGPARV